MGMAEDHDRFERALGAAVVRAWGDLPRDIQERLFEQAVQASNRPEVDGTLREDLAVFLHDRHPRTDNHQAP